MILCSILFLIGSGLSPAGEEDAERVPDPTEALRTARRTFEREQAPEARKEALRTMAQVALDDSSRLAAQARRALREGLDDRDLEVASEAVRLAVLTDEPKAIERLLASRLKDHVRSLRRFMAEVDKHRRVQEPRFLRSFPQWGGAEGIGDVPSHVQSLAVALASVTGDRSVDALEALLDLDPAANSANLVTAAVEGLLRLDDPEGVEAVVDWIRDHRKQFASSPQSERDDAPRARPADRFGRLQGLGAFRRNYPAVDGATYDRVREMLGQWARDRQLPSPPSPDGPWREWLRLTR